MQFVWIKWAKFVYRKFQTHTYQVFLREDRIDKGEMRVEYCPTHLILADFFTKTLMGELFRKLRDVIMGYTSIFDLDPTLLQSIKERVGI